jgi:hypothetical protein
VLEVGAIASGIAPAWSAVRTSDENPLSRWHYVEYSTDEKELYDLAADPYELDNLSSQPAKADIMAQLSQRLHELLEEGRVNRPDASIALNKSASYFGYNQFSRVATDSQTARRTSVRPGRSYDYFVNIENNTTAVDSFTVQATATGSNKMSVAYFANGIDVTAAVSGSGYSITDLEGGAIRSMVVRITVGQAPSGAAKRAVITVRSMTDTTRIDVVRAGATAL